MAMASGDYRACEIDAEEIMEDDGERLCTAVEVSYSEVVNNCNEQLFQASTIYSASLITISPQ